VPSIRPFKAVRYRDGTPFATVTAPPYDVISPSERDRLEASHPHNIVRVTLGSGAPEGDRYVNSARAFREWLSSGVLIEEAEPGYYIYRSDRPGAGTEGTTAGMVAALELEPLGSDHIFGHEKTNPGPKADRLELMRTTRANLEPLWFFAATPVEGFAELIGELNAAPALVDLTDPQGVRHRVWPAPGDRGSTVAEAMEASSLVVADGHHRYETALTYRDERRSEDGPGPWDSTLALISDPVASAPEVLAIHRLVQGVPAEGLPGLKPFSGTVGELAAVISKGGPGTIGVAEGAKLWTLPSDGPLDTVFLWDQVLEPAGATVRYEHDLAEVAASVAEGATAFIMAPVPIAKVAETALAGGKMPPKTTLFWPKPRSGLVMRDLDED
jgi:uncharacterized protein (DUF1015 family)